MVKRVTAYVKRLIISVVVTVVAFIGIVLVLSAIGAITQHGNKLSAVTTEAIHKLEELKTKTSQKTP